MKGEVVEREKRGVKKSVSGEDWKRKIFLKMSV